MSTPHRALLWCVGQKPDSLRQPDIHFRFRTLSLKAQYCTPLYTVNDNRCSIDIPGVWPIKLSYQSRCFSFCHHNNCPLHLNILCRPDLDFELTNITNMLRKINIDGLPFISQIQIADLLPFLLLCLLQQLRLALHLINRKASHPWLINGFGYAQSDAFDFNGLYDIYLLVSDSYPAMQFLPFVTNQALNIGSSWNLVGD